MSQDRPMTTGEALSIHQEEQELLALADTEESVDYVLQEIEADPRYEEARQIRNELSRFAGVADYKVLDALTRPDPVKEKSPVSTASAEVENYDYLLDEIEGREDQAEYYENRQKDISFIHGVLENHAERIAGAGKNPTRKQREAMERALKQDLRSFDTATMLTEPHRLMVMLESLIAKQDVPVAARQEVNKLISEKVRLMVETRARGETTPDDIAGWLKVGAHPGIAQRQLQQLLLGSHFRPMLGNTNEKTVSHYETFVRSLVRLVDEPNATALGLSIAEFKNPLVFGNSNIYETYLQLLPSYAVNRPDLTSRIVTARRVLTEVGLNIDPARVDAMIQETNNGMQNPKEYTSAIDAFEKLGSQEMSSIESRMARHKITHAEVIASGLMTEAIKELGMSEYEARRRAMLGGQELLNEAMTKADDYLDFMFGEQDSRLMDYFLKRVSEVYPDQLDFMRDVFTGPSDVRADADTYLADRTFEWATKFADKQNELGLVDPIYGEMNDVFKLLQRREINLGDGYIVTLMGVDEAELDADEATLRSMNPEIIEAEKARFAKRSKGMYSRNHALDVDALGFAGFMRRETAEDLKAIHPLEAILNDPRTREALKSDEDIDGLIEALRDLIIINRRRFMNIRGIAANLTENERDDASVRLELKKHPKNPQAFIGTLKVAGHAPAKFLLDPNMRIQLGKARIVNKEQLSALNAAAAAVLYTFMCEEAVDTEEGVIGEGKNAITERIAHLRLLPEGSNHSYEAWSNCLEAEGLDLEVLSRNAQLEKQTTRVSTYVKAIENDSEAKPPLLIYLDKAAQPAFV